MGQPRYVPCPESNLPVLEKLRRGYGVKLQQKDTKRICYLHAKSYAGVTGYKLLTAEGKAIPSWGNVYKIIDKSRMDDFLKYYIDMEIKNDESV
jgi:hypothetical protein